MKYLIPVVILLLSLVAVAAEEVSILPVEESNVSAVEEPAAPLFDSPKGLVVEPEPSVLQFIIKLLLDTISVIRGQIVELTASLFYEDGTPAVNKEVTFYAGEENLGSDLTDEAGKATLWWNTSAFGANVYVISAEYNGISDGKNIEIVEKKPESALWSEPL